MSKEEFTYAASIYLEIRKAVIEVGPRAAGEQTFDESARKLLVDCSRTVITEACFESNMRKSLNGLWNKLKLYPLWANVKAYLGTARVDAISKYNVAKV